jgi:ParB family transcriptional regulator, chromosome partitioning protein
MATPAPNSLNAQYENREIPLELIDEPAVPERETMEEWDLAELALSIAGEGLIKPLIVKQVGERFETIAGHRRLLGCRLAKYSPVPCRVKINDQVDDLAILVAENQHVEAVNTVEEARFYRRVLVEMCENDVDLLCLKVRRKRNYVEDRLVLLMGYPNVIDALQAKKISFAVARELNKVKDPNRLLIMLDVSITQGASARQVEQWRREADNEAAIQVASPNPDDQATNPSAIAPGFSMKCLFCEDGDDPHLMVMEYLHKPCKKIVERMMGRHQDALSNGNG